jgi:hypothetical protein
VRNRRKESKALSANEDQVQVQSHKQSREITYTMSSLATKCPEGSATIGTY